MGNSITHYLMAEKLLEKAFDGMCTKAEREAYVSTAQVYATLALAAVTATAPSNFVTSDVFQDWIKIERRS